MNRKVRLLCTRTARWEEPVEDQVGVQVLNPLPLARAWRFKIGERAVESMSHLGQQLQVLSIVVQDDDGLVNVQRNEVRKQAGCELVRNMPVNGHRMN